MDKSRLQTTGVQETPKNWQTVTEPGARLLPTSLARSVDRGAGTPDRDSHRKISRNIVHLALPREVQSNDFNVLPRSLGIGRDGLCTAAPIGPFSFGRCGSSLLVRMVPTAPARRRAGVDRMKPTPLISRYQPAYRCDGTGAASGRQSHEKAGRRHARPAFFLSREGPGTNAPTSGHR